MNPRRRNHLLLAALTVATLVIAWLAGPAAGAADRLSIVSAYLCLALLGAALLIGPASAWRERRPVTNSAIRRSLGIWAGVSGLLHFYLANVLSMNYTYLGIYVDGAEAPPAAAIRSSLYTWGTIAGYVVALLFLLLMLLSNDSMVRRLGLKRWKRLQRASYLVFLLTVGHAFAFQVLESRELFWVNVVLVVALVVIGAQIAGVCRVPRGLSKFGR